jgi:hypothetical protein
MLVGIVTERLNTYFERSSDNDTILWFDAKGEWERLLPYLKPHLPLLVYEGSLLQLRYQLVERSPHDQAVVYLPFEKLELTRRGEAEYMRPFIYTAKVFEDSIEAVLRDEGVELPESLVKMREIRPHLPALAVASVGKGRAFWKGLDNLEAVLARLFPDFEDRLMRLLASPEPTARQFENQGQREAFFTLLESKFGVESPDAGAEHEWANRFTATLCLVETFVASDEPTDFPFKQALPDPVHWDRCRDFLRKWQRDEMLNEAFARRARAVDDQYNLASWVKSLPQPPTAGGFLNVDRAIWDRTRQQLDDISDKAEAIAFCRARQDAFRQRAKGFWAREGSLPGWAALKLMAEVAIGADDALDAVSGYETASSLIERYTEEWWRVDRAYRHFRDQVSRGVGQLDAAHKWTRRIYQNFLETVNAHFVELVQWEGRWPPDDAVLGVFDLWERAFTGGHGRRALILVDALRYELGQELTERLQPSPQATPSTAFSPLPSITGLGMAALLPGWSEFEVDYADNDWLITAPGFEGNIAEKSDRLKWLEHRLESVAFYDLEEWLATPLDSVTRGTEWIVISSAEIDAVGEGAGPVTWHTTNALLRRLEQAVRRLLVLNCAEIHIVSDHGFLLRETIRESDKVTVDVPDKRLLKRSERYLLLLGPDLPAIDLPSLSVSGSSESNLIAVFPRGIGCFFSPGTYDFMHGGISLQELVAARVTVRQSVAERPVSVALELDAGPEIRNAIFKVRLAPQGADLLSRARRVEIDIAHEGERISEVWEAVVHRDAVEKSLRLSPQMGVGEGDAVVVRVWDADTGELLAQQPAVVQVDLDW